MSDQKPPAVCFKNVSKQFGDHKTLDDVSFEVSNGEALCILGRSGTGKSVTLRLMIGLIKPDSGVICVHEKNIVDMDEDQISQVRREMGFLFQSSALFDSFTLNDNLELPLRRFSKKSDQEIDQFIQSTLDEVGLGQDRHKMPVELSGGMRKRAGLARALILEPRILLVDEPSSGLDRVTASEIDELLLTLKQKEKTTIIIVTHDVRGARRVGDRLVVLDQGKIAGLGKPEELESSDNELVRALVTED